MRTTVAIVVRDGEIISVGTNEHKAPCRRDGYPSGEGIADGMAQQWG